MLTSPLGNWLGNQGWTEALEWPGQKGFNKAEIEDLKLDDGKKFGKVKTSGNFTFMQIFGAGHMGKNLPVPPKYYNANPLDCIVPMDQPEASLDFLNRWIGGEWY